MPDIDRLTDRFEEHRPRLRAVAYRMLGSHAEAEDAVQEAWLRVARAGDDGVDNLGGWLTTVVARQCLNMLRSRTHRREEPLDVHVPDPVVSTGGGDRPGRPGAGGRRRRAGAAGRAGVAGPAERLALVLHDMFAVPFDEIGPIVGRSPAAARQLASRARRRVRDGAPEPDRDPARQREVVDAWHEASRSGDFDALVALLDPDAELRVDGGVRAESVTKVVRGAARIAGQALMFGQAARWARTAMVNGTPGIVTAPGGRPAAVMAFTIVGGRIVRIDILADPDRLAALPGMGAVGEDG